ncbi:MAG: DUF2854 domain-containing protein [Pseudanabaena sp.]|jgi:hypothetical protein|uniref:DUF2854 domain-containing protein n=1 Tax=Pseudanabaena mucicola TaxID=71190 RepID=UPI0025759DA6|nr:DUF2854 domain-containing protein [Pseudanabaena mucicola]MCA6575048.1 DUF2854 domain-containing protein [Pseudanabaena sp. M53BS1SP1A06MG]MCA6584241.1 DUF2854 domain-containing protein [Pseudanabaena sp. M34BS1SP1A06MG]MCA6587254.1 DUF2854 domain-containing protein [Pseudanabaena sp. M051S1SP1A06QC]MCA6588750.1 DUF2854 domain-containing protein [Pseudanabaena sp. M109S1SP1A06QC]MCA6592939.1 DUF2854 domain-containing protein [Pseudanabaena sp. M38BS1SP1A06MG]MCA6597869.1 DUF2854 domain-con
MLKFNKISLASIGLFVGGMLFVVGFWAYSKGNSTLNLVGFFYGFPILLGGFAFKSSEVAPVPVIVPESEEVLALRKLQETSTQKQLRKDVTRYRYGIKAHLDEVLEKLGMRPTDEERPVLIGIYEEISQAEETKGAYSLVLRFQSPLMGFDVWQQKQDKLTRFFGPGIVAVVSELANKEVDLRLISQN